MVKIRKQLSDLELQKEFIQRSLPVLVKDAIHEQDYTAFSLDSLYLEFGNVVVPLACSDVSEFRLNPESGEYQEGIAYMSIKDFYFYVKGSYDTCCKWLYLHQLPIKRFLPGLFEKLMALKIMPWLKDIDANLWVSPAGCSTVLHFDSSDNIILQLEGSKTVTLFDPYQSSSMYPHSGDSRIPHVSRLSFYTEPDQTQFPLFKEAKLSIAEVNPGDMLFIPAFWWHYIVTKKNSVSINFWW